MNKLAFIGKKVGTLNSEDKIYIILNYILWKIKKRIINNTLIIPYQNMPKKEYLDAIKVV